MWTRWHLLRWVLSKTARATGFLDPVPLLARLERLAQPSEVAAPIELLRAGFLFHVRGLLNARVIQYNLDWVWPYWVEQQYDAGSEAFIPRAFSLTHVNLTHRNWTAVGLPDVDRHPVVDPRGLVTPLYDDWSLDAWLLPDEGPPLLPSRADVAVQDLEVGPEGPTGSGPHVETRVRAAAGSLVEDVEVVWDEGPSVRVTVRATGKGPGWLALALRPANPEGVSCIDEVTRPEPAALRVNGEHDVRFSPVPDRVHMSEYRSGDVLWAVRAETDERDEVSCSSGLATAAALFRLDEHGRAEVSARVSLTAGSRSEPGADVSGPPAGVVRTDRDGSADPGRAAGAEAWRVALEDTARLATPEPRFRTLYDAAVRSLVLHAPGDVYPGPYTYKRFWFRDAAFIVDALCSAGLVGRARDALSRYPDRQDGSGYFRSQEGEWDANGAALWAMDRYRRLSGEPLPEGCMDTVAKAAGWVAKKRLDANLDAPHAGLLPAGFSAEHLGPNDYFYWDDFWCAAGLRSAARLLRDVGEGEQAADRWEREADDLLAAVDRSVDVSVGHRRGGAIPASPYRRMDAGAVGSLCAGYPLGLWGARDERLLATVEHLLEHHTVAGAFFQDMMHSGLNAYLTLHLAQVLLRADDPRQETLVRTVAELASGTGQWPEAVHPRTGGGCMGDGQHIWAAAEWVLMIRNWFVREEQDRLILASGIPGDWIRAGEETEFGPTPTPYGPVTVRVGGEEGGALVEWSGAWRETPPVMEVRLPGYRHVSCDPGASRVRVDVSDPAAASRGAHS
ncbi:MAG: hypothetical protein U5R14_08740 [Gemmatimonadota bacterium]|nr:hypothetical protein [Gemmatimonadota bacterium]